MEDIKQKKLQLLEETVATYNLNNRCADESGKCHYSPKSLGLEGISPGCAIGRLLAPELQEQFDNTQPQSGADLVSSLPIGFNSLFKRLPEDLQTLGKQFLSDLQNLHDWKGYWDENGITEEGLGKVQQIKRVHELN